MAGENTVSTLDKGLKKIYSSDVTALEFNKNNPSWERCKKVNDFEGSTLDHTVPISYGAGIGVNIADANDSRSADSYARFSVTRQFVYGVGAVSGELIRVTKTNRGSVIGQALQTARDNQIETLKLYMRHSLWNNGGGALARIKAGSISGATLIVDDLGDLLWLRVGQKIHFSVDDGTLGGGIRAGVELLITNIDRNNGTITFGGAVPGGVGATDFLFRKGTYNAVFGGVPLWIPRTIALASGAIYGQARNVDPTVLSGVRHETALGSTVQEAIFLALERAFREGIEPDVIYLNPYDWIALPMVNQAQVQYGAGQNLVIGFGQGVKVAAPYGMVEILPDPGVKQGDGWLLTQATWEFHYAGDNLVELIKDDGMSIMREQNADSYAWRAGVYGNFLCRSPRKNMYFKLPPRTVS